MLSAVGAGGGGGEAGDKRGGGGGSYKHDHDAQRKEGGYTERTEKYKIKSTIDMYYPKM